MWLTNNSLNSSLSLYVFKIKYQVITRILCSDYVCYNKNKKNNLKLLLLSYLHATLGKNMYI